MARNEDGEFELMLGNKQLLSVFFLMVLLLALCFVGGYILGRSAAPVLTAVSQPPPPQATTAPAVIPPAPKAEPTKTVAPPPPKEEPAAPPPPPTKTAPQVSGKTPEPAPAAKEKEPAPKQTAKAEPPKSAPAAKQASGSSQPVAGRIYLQLSATDKDKAEVMVDLLRRKNFSGIAAPVAERPGLYRVLVGPLADTALSDTKAQLKANGFPADDAIRRVF